MQHDLYLHIQYINTKENILADAVSRQQWDLFHRHWGTYTLFAGCRAKDLQRLKEADPSDPASALPNRIALSVNKFRGAAYSLATKHNSASAWNAWLQCCMECDMDPCLDVDSEKFNLFLARFKAARLLTTFTERW